MHKHPKKPQVDSIGLRPCAPLREPCYLGNNGLLGFKNALAFVGAGDWERAAYGMLASKWAKQVGMRAVELSEMMRKGK